MYRQTHLTAVSGHCLSGTPLICCLNVQAIEVLLALLSLPVQ